jgi:hypothetical protein
VTQPTPTRSDPDLFTLAREVLGEEGYVIQEVNETGLDVLLAENPYFIVAVATAPTIDELILAEGRGEEILQARLRGADVGPKVWDAYLVLLTQERLVDGGEATRQLFSINYDTRAIRRIAQSDVNPTLRDVRLALRPFVAPLELDDRTIAMDAFSTFVDALSNAVWKLKLQHAR